MFSHGFWEKNWVEPAQLEIFSDGQKLPKNPFLAFLATFGLSRPHSDFKRDVEKMGENSGVLRVARGGSGAKAPPLAARPDDPTPQFRSFLGRF